MVTKDLKYGQATIRRLLRALDEPVGLEHKYAQAVLRQAIVNASGRPTPQAPMAAANMSVNGATIAPVSAGDAADVAIGSEFGSTLYRQFQAPVNPRGYWLYPAAESIQAKAAGERVLEDMLDDAVRGF